MRLPRESDYQCHQVQRNRSPHSHLGQIRDNGIGQRGGRCHSGPRHGYSRLGVEAHIRALLSQSGGHAGSDPGNRLWPLCLQTPGRGYGRTHVGKERSWDRKYFHFALASGGSAANGARSRDFDNRTRGHSMNESILLVEDEKALRTTLSDRLRTEGYVVETASDGLEGVEMATNQPFDLIILDLLLPRRGGLDVCRDIRAAGMAIPILVLTVRNDTVDKVVGLKLGADDYVTKPFEASELLARIEVLLRRVPIHSGHGSFKFGAIRVDVRQAEVTRDSKPVYLTARE